ncbi:hypothetical protein DRJ48_01790 [Candidatus Woesearchaeota archaeon]|nr:MAG: hypothetical protein DRJ48_01790 [Candidatus Woesearchaeota archaeon]
MLLGAEIEVKGRMRKGQAAMEFLMTYGWAILVVLAAIGALAYFGVLSPARFLPERCTGPAGMDCLEKASIDASADTVSWAIKNNLGHGINITNILDNPDETGNCDTITEKAITVDGTTTVLTGSNQVSLANGKEAILRVNCSGFDSGKFSGDFSVVYKSLDTGLQHKAAYSIRGKAT